MTFFEELPPIEDRALESNGREMFVEMISMQLRLIKPSPSKIARKLKWKNKKGAEVACQLENAGLVSLNYNGPHNVHAMHLTRKGREVAREMGLAVNIMSETTPRKDDK